MNILGMRAPQGILNNEHTLSTRRAARTDELPWRAGRAPSPLGWIQLAQQAIDAGDLECAARLIASAYEAADEGISGP